MNKLFIIPALMLSIASCSQKINTEDRAFKIFNEGVSLSLNAGEAAGNGDYGRANDLNKKAIGKFKETMAIDSTHSGAVSALAHSMYLDKNYREAIFYFEKAIEMQPNFAVNYQELGLSKINLGGIEEGKKDLEKAFAIDNSEELKNNTILDLQDIGTLAFEFGEGYIEQGEKEKGEGYKRFSIGVLLTTYELDTSRKEVAKLVSDYASKIGDMELAEKYRVLAQ